jgi:hypothetical protein
LAGEGYALEVARSMAQQVSKFDPETRIAAKKFTKPIPASELKKEIELFSKLFNRPVVMESLRRFIESADPMKHLPARTRQSAPSGLQEHPKEAGAPHVPHNPDRVPRR